MALVTGTQYAQTSDLANLGMIGSALSSVSAGTQNAALQAASAVADSYLQSRYVLPLTAWGIDLVRIVCIIAAYDLLTSRGFGPQQGVDDNIRKRYLDAIKWLEGVREEEETPSQIADSSTGSTGQLPPSTQDGSVAVSTEGGFQAQTSNVRGWTRRGQVNPTTPGPEFWDDNTGR